MQQDQGSLYAVHAPVVGHPMIFLPTLNRTLPAKLLCYIKNLPHLQETNLSLGRPSMFVTAALL